MSVAIELGLQVGFKPACEALEVSRATLYRRLRPAGPPSPRPTSPRALTAEERAEVLRVLHSERFKDSSVPEVYATLLSEGVYLASSSTMYRILRASSGTRERRNVREHPRRVKPVLTATGPNQVWTWDITRLRGPKRGDFYYLYVVIDIYSRMVVGWLLTDHESAEMAELLLSATLERHGIGQGELTIHSDRGAPMTSQTVAQLLAELDVKRSLSRPRVSNDNPFSESQFKTTKYNPWFPGKFLSEADAREYCRGFFRWYNDEHCHSGIAQLPPRVVHEGRADEVLAQRQAVLDAAYAHHPERFVHGRPSPGTLPEVVSINPEPQAVEVAGPPQSEEVGGPSERAQKPPPEASDRPSPARSADRQGGPEATERPEPPGPTHSAEREHGEDGEDATLPETRAAVPEGGAGRLEAGQSESSIEAVMGH